MESDGFMSNDDLDYIELNTRFNKVQQENTQLKEALKQILGWRELRSGNGFPVERIEEIARLAMQGEE